MNPMILILNDKTEEKKNKAIANSDIMIFIEVVIGYTYYLVIRCYSVKIQRRNFE